MQSKEVKAFKNRLRYYAFLKDEIHSLEQKIEDLYDRLGGVRGVDPSKEPMHAMPNKEVEWKVRELISKLDADLSHRLREKDEIDQILFRMETDDREAVIAVYVQGNHCDKVARQHHMSPSGLKSRMDRQIKKALQQ